LRAWATPEMGWGRAAIYSLGIGVTVTALSVVLAVAWLEAEDRGGMRRAAWAETLIYLPLLLPQIAFLYGLNLLFLRMGISGGLAAVIWAQGLFVFPYVMIAFSDPWRALDQRVIRTAASLGAGPNERLFRVKLPLLMGPLLTAAAIGFAVSIAQYLPTLFMGAGRIATLTTEAVTLSSGSDRRVIGTYAVLQALLPFAAYGLALLLPRILYRDRRGLRGGH
jgi:putative thiamine transport system permease protein